MTDLASRLARIETHIGAIQADQAASKSELAELRAYLVRIVESQETRLRAVEIDCAMSTSRIGNLGEEVGTLRKRVYTWDVINTLGALLAGLVGMGER